MSLGCLLYSVALEILEDLAMLIQLLPLKSCLFLAILSMMESGEKMAMLQVVQRLPRPQRYPLQLFPLLGPVGGSLRADAPAKCRL